MRPRDSNASWSSSDLKYHTYSTHDPWDNSSKQWPSFSTVENIRQICQNIAKYPSSFPKLQSKFGTRGRPHGPGSHRRNHGLAQRRRQLAIKKLKHRHHLLRKQMLLTIVNERREKQNVPETRGLGVSQRGAPGAQRVDHPVGALPGSPRC